jgi:transcriptional regulator with XRE-family HTH domain
VTNKTNNVVKEFRQQNGITQKSLAKMLAVTSRTIRRWENGTRPIHHLLPFALRGIAAMLMTGELNKKESCGV